MLRGAPTMLASPALAAWGVAHFLFATAFAWLVSFLCRATPALLTSLLAAAPFHLAAVQVAALFQDLAVLVQHQSEMLDSIEENVEVAGECGQACEQASASRREDKRAGPPLPFLLRASHRRTHTHTYTHTCAHPPTHPPTHTHTHPPIHTPNNSRQVCAERESGPSRCDGGAEEDTQVLLLPHDHLPHRRAVPRCRARVVFLWGC